MLPSSFANRLVSLVFYDTLDQQKELAFAFGGQRSWRDAFAPVRKAVRDAWTRGL